MINVKCKTKAKATLRLYNIIISYLFEQEYDELKNQTNAIKALNRAKEELLKIINNG